MVALVRDLLKRNGLISPLQAAKHTMDLIEDLQKHLPSHLKVSLQQPPRFPSLLHPGMSDLLTWNHSSRS